MSGTAAAVVILYLISLGILVAFGLWVVAIAVLALVVGGALLNKLTGSKVRAVSGSQIQIVERVAEQMSVFGEELNQLRGDLNRTVWAMNTRSAGIQSDPHYIALLNKVIDIENRLNHVRGIVERPEEPAA